MYAFIIPYTFFSDLFRNYSGTFLAPPVAALEKEGDFAGTPRAPARGLRPPAEELLHSLHLLIILITYVGPPHVDRGSSEDHQTHVDRQTGKHYHNLGVVKG